MAPIGLYARLCHAFLVFSFLIGARLSHDLLDRFSPYFHRMKAFFGEIYGSKPLFSISQRTLPWQPILGKIGKITFIRRARVPVWLGIWQFRLKNIQSQYCSYIVCKYDRDWSSNPRDYKGNNCTFLVEMANIGVSH